MMHYSNSINEQKAILEKLVPNQNYEKAYLMCNSANNKNILQI